MKYVLDVLMIYCINCYTSYLVSIKICNIIWREGSHFWSDITCVLFFLYIWIPWQEIKVSVESDITCIWFMLWWCRMIKLFVESTLVLSRLQSASKGFVGKKRDREVCCWSYLSEHQCTNKQRTWQLFSFFTQILLQFLTYMW